MSRGRVEAQVAVVTGGGAGIGRATCRRLAAEGAVVIACDIDEDASRETAGLVSAAGGRCHHRRLDVRDETGWAEVLDEVGAAYGAPTILVNNAGLPYRRSLPDSSWQEWQALMAVNAGGAFLGLKHGTRVMAANGGGAIVNIASAAALVGVASMTSYSAGKGAIRSMSRAAAIEFADRGVRVNAVFPTSVRTAMVESDAHDTGISSVEFVGLAAALSPLGRVSGRIAEPDDVADAVLFLSSEESRFITGAELVLDGGATAGVG